jgi:MFS family permease
VSPLTSYRRLIELAGPAYVVVAFLGRLPLAMSQLGTLLFVSAATDSYGTGGAAAGALAVANAVGAPVAGGIADRVGQRGVVLVQSMLGAVGLVSLVSIGQTAASDGWLVAVAAATGLVMPQVGPLARVRWRPITEGSAHQRRLVDAAFSYEGAADEASFVLGPALVGVAAVAVSPAGALLTAAVMLAVFGSAFAMHRTALLTRVRHAADHHDRLWSAAFVTLFVAQAGIGSLFGSVQTGTTVLATEAGHAGVAGLVHAMLGVGSVIAGLGTAFLPERIPHERRWLTAAVALPLLSAPLLLVHSIPALIGVVLLLGFAVAPYMIGIFTLGERIVPPTRVGAALTLLAGATGIGYAVGSSIAGRLGDAFGYTAAFAVTVTVTSLAALLAATSQRRVRVARLAAARPAPSTAAGELGVGPVAVVAADRAGAGAGLQVEVRRARDVDVEVDGLRGAVHRR